MTKGRLSPIAGKVRLARLDRVGILKSTAFVDTSRGSRHQRGYGTAWDKLRRLVMRRDAGLCQVCKERGMVRLGRAVDHKVPRFEGGQDDLENLQVICDECHASKSAAESQRARGAR